MQCYFRKIELYVLEWAGQVSPSSFIVFGGTFGGPLAVMTNTSNKPTVHTLSASARKITSFKVINNTKLGKISTHLPFGSPPTP